MIRINAAHLAQVLAGVVKVPGSTTVRADVGDLLAIIVRDMQTKAVLFAKVAGAPALAALAPFDVNAAELHHEVDRLGDTYVTMVYDGAFLLNLYPENGMPPSVVRTLPVSIPATAWAALDTLAPQAYPTMPVDFANLTACHGLIAPLVENSSRVDMSISKFNKMDVVVFRPIVPKACVASALSVIAGVK